MIHDILIEEDLATADLGAIEVRLSLADGRRRWCFFMTPAALKNCGDWMPGTTIRMHVGALHMNVVAEISAEIIEKVLRLIDDEGEIELRTRPL